MYVNAIRDLEGERLNTQYGIGKLPWRALKEYVEFNAFPDPASFIDILADVDTFLVAKRNKRLHDQMVTK